MGGVNNDELVSILNSQSLPQIETIFKYSNGFQIGKTGLESTYDQILRGRFGKKIFEVDAMASTSKIFLPNLPLSI